LLSTPRQKMLPIKMLLIKMLSILENRRGDVGKLAHRTIVI